MSGIDILIVAAIAAGLGFALRHMKKNKGGCGCGSGSGGCAGCDGNCGGCSYRK